MISPFVAVQAVNEGERFLVNIGLVLAVRPVVALDGRACIRLVFSTGDVVVFGTLDEWERATGTTASVGRTR